MINKLDLECLQKEFSSADPFPHVVIDDFLLPEIATFFSENFPNLNTIDENFIKKFDSGYGGELKRQISPNGCDEKLSSVFHKFNQDEFLKVLEKITSINGLIADHTYEGGGFHQTFKGGRLGIHTDFRVHKNLLLKRELNMIIYLNKDWTKEWGGDLELWSRDKTNLKKQVSPAFNRCVIFKTDGSSYHGHPHPLNCPNNLSRKSIALYYYSGSNLIYLENSRKTTDYIKGNSTKFSFLNRVKYKSINLFLEFCPPILARKIFSFRSNNKFN